MFKKSLAMFVVLAALPAPVLAGSYGTQAKAAQARGQTAVFNVLGTAPGANAVRKSARQKCLDMMLPQDGVDCLKKLKAKKKKK